MCLLEIVRKYNEYVFEKIYNKPYDSELDELIIHWSNEVKETLLKHRISVNDVLFDCTKEVIINNHRFMMILGYYNYSLEKNVYWR